MLIHDAATTFVTLVDAAVLWVVTLAAALAFVACVAAIAVGPLIAPVARTVRRATPTPAPARRRVPSWAHTEPYDYDATA